jgi:SAM-dependent methyltransferase
MTYGWERAVDDLAPPCRFIEYPTGTDLMDSAHLTELLELEDNYWWHVAKRNMVSELLKHHFPAPGCLIEGGVGAGRNLLEFRELGYSVHGYDIMPEAVAHCRERGIQDVQVHDLEQPWPTSEGSVRAVVMLDVLEHLADPVRVLKHARNALAEDGGLVFTVPAHPVLFGDWDRRLGHFRRYTAKMIRQQAQEAGLAVKYLSHWNALSLPAAYVVRGYQKFFPKQRPAEFPRVAPWVNRMMLRACAAERWLDKSIGVHLGLSVVGILHKW